MTILASINLNKRFNNQKARSTFAGWLSRCGVEVVFTQEPWKVAPNTSTNFGDFVPAGGNIQVFTWIHAQRKTPPWEMTEEFCQRVELDYLVVYNVYLDAYKRERRASQLSKIQKSIIAEKDRPVLVVGDFNIAPNPEDGIIDGRTSTFNSKVDRGMLHQLLTKCCLVDLGRSTEAPRWTIEREMRGQKVQFRCDLALASDYISSSIKMQASHETRITQQAFTDHSGLLLDVPVTLMEIEHQMMLFPPEPTDSTLQGKVEFKPEKTAIHRTGPSSVAKALEPLIQEVQIGSVLDYGCGYGEDVKFYRALGLQAEGFDPYPPFGWSQQPTDIFELVTVIFVLNVLPDPWARLKVINEAAKYLSPHGLMVVASRSPDEIRREAEMKNWKVFNDGYWSHEGKGTFQHGLSKDELIIIARREGFTESPLNNRLTAPQGTACVVLHRKTS